MCLDNISLLLLRPESRQRESVLLQGPERRSVPVRWREPEPELLWRGEPERWLNVSPES